MMESIALTESHMVVDAVDEDYVMVRDDEDMGDDASYGSYDMCDAEDLLDMGDSPLSPVPSISTSFCSDIKDLDTLMEEKASTSSIGASVVSLEDKDEDVVNSDAPPALLSDLEGSSEDTKKAATTARPPKPPARPRSSVPSDQDLKKAEEQQSKANKGSSRPSNKKRRKKIKMMKKAAAAAAAAAALSDMNGSAAAAAASSTMTPTRQHKVKTASSAKSSRKATNIQVAVATQTLAEYRAEHGL